MAEVNQAEVRNQPAPIASLKAAQWTYVQETSPATYVQLGRHLGLRTIDSLEGVLRVHGNPGAALRKAKPSTEVATYRALGGLFIEHAQQSGLLGEAPLTHRKRALLQAVFLRKWVTAVPARSDVWSHLRAEEHRWYLRYLAEAQHRAPLADTLAAGINSVGSMAIQRDSTVRLLKRRPGSTRMLPHRLMVIRVQSEPASSTASES